MKKLLSVLVIFVINNKIQSQVVFCPPGAEWHYHFYPGEFGMPPVEEIKYVRDSIFNGESVKVLKHNRFYLEWNLPQSGGCILTLLKQKGDTVFIKNPGTQNKWQILYNFAALPGQSWCNKICDVDTLFNPDPNAAWSYTVTVDSVKSVFINNFSLKRLFVRYIVDLDFPPLFQYAVSITERLGCNFFMFSYQPLWSMTDTQADTFSDFLCYKDDTFGLKQFTDHSCDYSNVGIEKNAEFKNGINVYPNPSNDKIFFDIPFQDNIEIIVHSPLGSEVLKIKNYQNISALDVSGLDKGVYFYNVRIKTNNYFGKFVKD